MVLGAILVATALAGPATGAKKRKQPRIDPFAGCYRHANRPYNFGFYGVAPLDYLYGPPATSPYTPVPSCRVTTAARGDKPANRIDASQPFTYTNARVAVLRLRPEARDQQHDAWALHDSLGKVAAWIREVPQPRNRTLWEVWSREWGGPSLGGGTLLATRNMSPDVAPFKVQGRACTTSRTLVNTHYAIQFPNLRTTLPGLESSDIGRPSAWGFIDAAALDFSDALPSELAKLARARAHDKILTSCGRLHPLAGGTLRSAAFRLSTTPFAIPKHHFLGGTSWKRCNPDDPAGEIGEDGQCGTYGQYWAVPGTSLRVVASSTTGVAGGGLPLALLPHYLRFRAIRYVNYCDRNVPRVQTVADTFRDAFKNRYRRHAAANLRHPALAKRRNSAAIPSFHDHRLTRFSLAWHSIRFLKASLTVRGRVWDGTTRLAAWNRGGNAFWIFGKWWIGGKARYVYGWTPEPCERLSELRQALR